jgi:hypothetical protein
VRTSCRLLHWLGAAAGPRAAAVAAALPQGAADEVELSSQQHVHSLFFGGQGAVGDLAGVAGQTGGPAGELGCPAVRRVAAHRECEADLGDCYQSIGQAEQRAGCPQNGSDSQHK